LSILQAELLIHSLNKREYYIMKQGTICVQGAYRPKNGEPRVLPIVQSTTYKYDSSVEMGDLFDLKKSGYFYSRLQNPTNDTVAAKITMLEGGVAGMLTSSGQAANFYAVFNIAQAGDHIVSSSAIYGGTYNLFNVTMRKLGIDFTFVSPDATEEEIQAAFKPNTKAVFGETISNPSLDILDIERFAKVAHKNGVPLIVDNTFATPINCRVFDWGVDIVTHSTTKYMEGHASTIGGVIVDSGNFDWTQNDKFPGLTTPDESYHGITYCDTFGKGAYITKATVQLMRDLGSMPSPHDAFLLNVGLESLHLRVARHCENAKKVAEYLKNHDKITWVNCAMLEDDKQYAKAQKYMPNGTCGVVSFGIKGGRAAATKFMDSLKLAAIVTHVADARSCCLHPASTTHRQLTDEQLKECGVTPDLIRFSCGIEDCEDIIADIEQALAQI
jgi:O-acetylhomoserine (thiol)-lyase